ncbi:MAG: glycosyltransferase family 39 protein [Chloroflexota bacterium]
MIQQEDATKRSGRSPRTTKATLQLAAILLLALALRFYRLGAQSLWNDEGTTVQLVGADLGTITRLAASDIHPPLYYYALHFWVAIFGTSEFAARSLSALLGTVLVALVYLLGRRLYDSRTGILAAFVTALAPFQVYYSQEARMYILATMLGAVSTFLLVTILDAEGKDDARKGERKAWYLPIAYVLVTSAALYTHYLAFSLLLAQNLCWILVIGHSLWRTGQLKGKVVLRRLAFWAAMQIAIVGLYCPWLLMTWEQLGRWPAVSEPFGFIWMLQRTLLVFGLGVTVEISTTTGAIAAGFGLLAILGAMYGVLRGDRDGMKGSLVAWSYCSVPVLVLYILSRQRPLWNPKFLLLASPGFYILVAHGAPAVTSLVSRFSRRAVSIALTSVLLFVILASGLSLHNLYHDPRYARDDYRGIVRYIEATAGPNDAIIINAPSQIETVAHYYRGDLPMYPLPRHRPLRRDETEAELQDIAARHERVFAILWATDQSDQDRFIEGWLDAHTYKALDEWHGNVRLAVYAVPQEPPTEITYPLDAVLGDSIRLLGYALPSAEVRAGDVLQLTLFWEATQPILRRYKVFVHVLDGEGQLVSQRDSEPGGGARLTNTWQPGETVLDNYGVLIPLDARAGEYQVKIGMYHIKDSTRLPITLGGQAVGDYLLLDPVIVR